MSQASMLPTIQVELFGVPRILTGRHSLSVSGQTLCDVAAVLSDTWPMLRGTVFNEQGWLLGGYIFVVDDCFTRNPEQTITPDTEVLLVSSIAGG